MKWVRGWDGSELSPLFLHNRATKRGLKRCTALMCRHMTGGACLSVFFIKFSIFFSHFLLFPLPPSSFQLTLVWSDEVEPAGRIRNGLYKIFRLVRYGRTRDIESLFVVPARGNTSATVFFPGVFAGSDADFKENEHKTATLDAALFSSRGGRLVLHSRTWNHLMAAKEVDLPIEQTARCSSGWGRERGGGRREAVERALSFNFPWKATYSTAAAGSKERRFGRLKVWVWGEGGRRERPSGVRRAAPD